MSNLTSWTDKRIERALENIIRCFSCRGYHSYKNSHCPYCGESRLFQIALVPCEIVSREDRIKHIQKWFNDAALHEADPECFPNIDQETKNKIKVLWKLC